MKTLLVAHADQKLSGLRCFYLKLHLSQCRQCRAALEALLGLGERLKALRTTNIEATLTPEREAALLAAYTDAEARHKIK
jgi:predicted anti-sigma-YlaC factor YlaD